MNARQFIIISRVIYALYQAYHHLSEIVVLFPASHAVGCLYEHLPDDERCSPILNLTTYGNYAVLDIKTLVVKFWRLHIRSGLY